MRYFDADEVKELNAEPWQIDLLHLNPAYCAWGPREDYMWKEGGGWDSRVVIPTWAEFGWSLDDLNECVNFYFDVNRQSVKCETCEGNGCHPDAQQTVRTFYRHSCLAGEVPWNADITEDEAAALVEAGRGRFDNLQTAADFNKAQLGGGFCGHDAINRHILIEARLARLGLPKVCPTCDGNGYVYTADKAHVSLILWWLHPRKGCSRGIEITSIEQGDLPVIYAKLASAAQRNADRFAAVSAKAIEARQGGNSAVP